MEDNCVRGDEVIAQNSTTTYTTLIPKVLNFEIATCAGNVAGAKLQSPSNLSSLTGYQDLIHVTFTSTVLGFIDDMYMKTYLDVEH